MSVWACVQRRCVCSRVHVLCPCAPCAPSQVEWAPDCRAIAVGYMRQGLVVWSPSGCRLMCSLRQVPNQYGRDSLTGSLRSGVDDLPSAASLSRQVSVPPPELDSVGVSQLAWGPQGYALTVANTGCSWQLSEVQFARSLPRHHRVSHAGPGWLASACTSTSTSALPGPGPGLGGPSTQHTMHGGQPLGEELHVLQAHDRLLVIGEALQASAGGPGPVTGRPHTRHGNLTSVGSGDAGAVQPASDLVVSHVVLPHQYINANWPIMHAAVSSSGMDMAVAGTHGLALYSRASDRWVVEVRWLAEVRLAATPDMLLIRVKRYAVRHCHGVSMWWASCHLLKVTPCVKVTPSTLLHHR